MLLQHSVFPVLREYTKPQVVPLLQAWIKTLLSKSFSIVVIVMFVVLVSKLNLHDFLGDNILTDIILPTGCIENMFMMMLTAAGVKGADSFLKQTFGI